LLTSKFNQYLYLSRRIFKQGPHDSVQTPIFWRSSRSSSW